MTRPRGALLSVEECADALLRAGIALGERERHWFGSLYDLGRDLSEAARVSPERLAEVARSFAGQQHGPLARQLCLFARKEARAVAAERAGRR